VIKCHGNASNPAFIQGIQRAFELAEMEIGDKIQKQLQQV
jgi:fatty acid/phospholipid biosynthesis enzyme